jgi:transposase
MSIQKRRKYTTEFKQDAVKLVTEQGYKVPEAARNLGINEGVLRRWMNEFGKSLDGEPDSKGFSKEQQRIRQLEKEVKHLKMEREILKKATAFFVKESS